MTPVRTFMRRSSTRDSRLATRSKRSVWRAESSPTIDFSPGRKLLLHELLEEFVNIGAGVARTPRGVGKHQSGTNFKNQCTGNALTPRGVRAFENSNALTPRGVSATPQVNRRTAAKFKVGTVVLSAPQPRQHHSSFSKSARGSRRRRT